MPQASGRLRLLMRPGPALMTHDSRLITHDRSAMLVATGVLLMSAISSAAMHPVRGRITDPAGLPLPGVVVTLVPAFMGPSLTAVTNEAGVYLVDAPAGRY